MNQYVTGAVIKELREKCQLTQAELANKLNVSSGVEFMELCCLYAL